LTAIATCVIEKQAKEFKVRGEKAERKEEKKGQRGCSSSDNSTCAAHLQLLHSYPPLLPQQRREEAIGKTTRCTKKVHKAATRSTSVAAKLTAKAAN